MAMINSYTQLKQVLVRFDVSITCMHGLYKLIAVEKIDGETHQYVKDALPKVIREAWYYMNRTSIKKTDRTKKSKSYMGIKTL